MKSTENKLGWRKLVVADRAISLVLDVYELAAKCLPDDEKYGLSKQIKRCVASVPANIVEGYSRGHTREFVRFLYIARGSVSELEVYLEILERLGFAFESDLKKICNKIVEIQQMLSKLIRSLQAKYSDISAFDVTLNSSLLTQDEVKK